MMAADCLTEEDLSAGTLPAAMNKLEDSLSLMGYTCYADVLYSTGA